MNTVEEITAQALELHKKLGTKVSQDKQAFDLAHQKIWSDWMAECSKVSKAYLPWLSF